jgi:hypothetical protein
MRTLAFGFKVADWAELQEMSFSAVFFCLRQAAEWMEEARGVAEKKASQRGW